MNHRVRPYLLLRREFELQEIQFRTPLPVPLVPHLFILVRWLELLYLIFAFSLFLFRFSAKSLSVALSASSTEAKSTSFETSVLITEMNFVLVVCAEEKREVKHLINVDDCKRTYAGVNYRKSKHY
ncbi:unnamed protein product [Linum tenue]|uniref:Uncharacterized protein n=1 Tax=Linum tenue TaxID=586396 RepID=A0AAV0J5W1_9ROSI|nr:unnamed protein product [Linum tenue]